MDEEDQVCVAPSLLMSSEPSEGERERERVEMLHHGLHGAELAHGVVHASHGAAGHADPHAPHDPHAAHGPHATPHDEHVPVRTAPGSGGPHDPEYWSADPHPETIASDATTPASSPIDDDVLRRLSPTQSTMHDDMAPMIEQNERELAAWRARAAQDAEDATAWSSAAPAPTTPAPAPTTSHEAPTTHDAPATHDAHGGGAHDPHGDAATVGGEEAGDAAAASPSILSRLFGGVGLVGGLRQMSHGVDELFDGEYAAGAMDLASGGLGAFTGGMAVLGEAAAVSSPVGLGAGLLGAASAGEHYNQEHGTFGVDEEGHGISSFELTRNMAQGSYDYVHDGVAEAIDGGEEGGVGDWVGLGLGSVAGVAGGVAGGFVGAGGDLLYGVPQVVGGLYDLALGAGEDYNAEHDVWGDPTVDEEGHVHHLTSTDFARAQGQDAYDGVHDSIAGAIGGTTGEVIGGLTGGLAGAVVGGGAGIIGVGGDMLRTAERVVTSGDRYMAERDVWGPQIEEPDGSTHHRSSVDMVVDDTVATYDDWHDTAAAAGLGDTASSAIGGVAGGAMAVGDSVLALAGNMAGLVGAGGETAAHAASAAWSWLTE